MWIRGWIYLEHNLPTIRRARASQNPNQNGGHGEPLQDSGEECNDLVAKQCISWSSCAGLGYIKI